MWYDKLLVAYPPPWEYKADAAECGNGSSIDIIEDSKGNCVLSDYNVNHTMFNAIWAWYETLTEEDFKKAKLMRLRANLRRALKDEDEQLAESLKVEIEALDPDDIMQEDKDASEV